MTNTLRWNQTSLDRAEAVKDERVADFYPSLYLNMGKAHEDLGNFEQARKYYELASARIGGLPEGAYKRIVEGGVTRGLERVT